MQHRSLGSTGADFGRLYTILDFLSSNVYSLINVKIKVDIVAFSATHTDSQLLWNEFDKKENKKKARCKHCGVAKVTTLQNIKQTIDSSKNM